MELRVGEPVPDFTVETTDGRRVSLSDYRGRYLVLYFYPKAFTPGCTKESRRFRDNYAEIRELGAEVLGASVDEPGIQCEFAESNRLSFPLVADHDTELSRAYGVLRRFPKLDKRITFVIDPEGRLVARFHHEFQVSKHLDEVLLVLREKRESSGVENERRLLGVEP